MKSQIAKLIDVKSIITFIVILGLVAFTQQGMIEGDKFFQIVTVIVTFYFGTQTGKATAEKSNTISVETKPTNITLNVDGENHTDEMAQSAAYVGE